MAIFPQGFTDIDVLLLNNEDVNDQLIKEQLTKNIS